MKPITYLLIFTGLLNAHAAQPKFQPTDWPAWRGLRGDGHAQAGSTGFPTRDKGLKNPAQQLGWDTATRIGDLESDLVAVGQEAQALSHQPRAFRSRARYSGTAV